MSKFAPLSVYVCVCESFVCPRECDLCVYMYVYRCVCMSVCVYVSVSACLYTRAYL